MGISSSKRGSGGQGWASGLAGAGLGQSQAAWGAPSSGAFGGARGHADAVKSGQAGGGAQGMAGVPSMFANPGAPSPRQPGPMALGGFGSAAAQKLAQYPNLAVTRQAWADNQPPQQPGPMAPRAPTVAPQQAGGADGLTIAAAARRAIDGVLPGLGGTGRVQVTSPQAMPVGGWRPPSLAEVQAWLISQGRDPSQAAYFLETM